MGSHLKPTTLAKEHLPPVPPVAEYLRDVHDLFDNAPNLRMSKESIRAHLGLTHKAVDIVLNACISAGYLDLDAIAQVYVRASPKGPTETLT